MLKDGGISDDGADAVGHDSLVEPGLSPRVWSIGAAPLWLFLAPTSVVA